MSKDTKAVATAPDAPAVAEDTEFQRLLKQAAKNPATIEFPRDEWGMTTELRKAGLRGAASIRGNEAKLRVYLATLSILALHAKARLDDDKASNAARLAESAEFYKNERVYGTPVPAPATEQAVK
jgi:hypothetical protein